MRYPPSQVKIRSFIGYQLPSLILGVIYTLPLIMPFYQFAFCNIVMLIFIACKNFTPNIFLLFQLYLYSFLLSISLLFQNSYYNSFAIGAFLGLLNNVQQLMSTNAFHFQLQFKFIGMLNYFILIQNYPVEYTTIYTFAIITICRLFLFDDVKHLDEGVIPLELADPLNITRQIKYYSVLSSFISDGLFFGSLYYLYQQQFIDVISAMILLIFFDIILFRIRWLMILATKYVVFLELLLLIQLVLWDLVKVVPTNVIIITLFVCRPFNQFYAEYHLSLEQYHLSKFNKQLIHCISSIITGLLIF